MVKHSINDNHSVTESSYLCTDKLLQETITQLLIKLPVLVEALHESSHDELEHSNCNFIKKMQAMGKAFKRLNSHIK